MHTVGHDPKAFREPIGFVDTPALLTLAGAIGTTLVMGAMAIASWYGVEKPSAPEEEISAKRCPAKKKGIQIKDNPW